MAYITRSLVASLKIVFALQNAVFRAQKNGFMTESVHFSDKKFGVLQEMSTFAIA